MLPLHTTFKTFALVQLLLTVFASCYNSNTNVEVIEALNESIENSSNWLGQSSKDIMISFEEKLRNDGSKERAQYWYPKAKKIEQLSGGIFNYIENLKNNLDSKVSFSSELFDKLIKYKNEILVVDPQITHEFQKSLTVFTKAVDSAKFNQKTLIQNYFNKRSITSMATMLNKLQNNIRVIENKIILYCHEHVGSTDGHGLATSVSVVSIINSSVVQPGDDIEIFSGVGEFNTFYKPEVFVYGKVVPIDQTGVAVSKLNAPAKPGKYSVPIKIQYIDQDGRQQTFQKEIEYTVANIQKQ